MDIKEIIKNKEVAKELIEGADKQYRMLLLKWNEEGLGVRALARALGFSAPYISELLEIAREERKKEKS